MKQSRLSLWSQTCGMLALASGVLIFGGCTLLPKALLNSGVPYPELAKKGLSGPVTVHLDNIPVDRSVQTLGSAAKIVEIKLYAANGAGVATVIEPYTNFSGLSATATAAVSAGKASLSIPPIPQGNHWVVVKVYNLLSGYNDTNLVAQTESAVNPTPGVPVDLTLSLYNTYATLGNLNITAAPATASVSFAAANAAATGTGLRLRMGLFDLTNLGNITATSSIRVSIVVPTAYAATLASGSAWYMVGDPWAASNFTATSSMTWNWSNTAHTGIDAVIGGDGVTNILDDANYQGGGASGSLSLSLPAAMVPTGYTVTLTDQASGPALSTSTTIQ